MWGVCEILTKIGTACTNPSPFEISYDANICMFEDWAAALESFFSSKPKGLQRRDNNFGIRSCSQLKYVNGRLFATSGYTEHLWIEYEYFKPEVLKSQSFRNVTLNKTTQPGLAAKKVADVKALYKYLNSNEVIDLELTALM